MAASIVDKPHAPFPSPSSAAVDPSAQKSSSITTTASQDNNTASSNSFVRTSHLGQWAQLIRSPDQRPLLVHLNADTSWLVSLPWVRADAPSSPGPPAGRTRFNVLIDPWFQGPQSDVAAFFSTQWHVVQPSVATIAELNDVLRSVESYPGCNDGVAAASNVSEPGKDDDKGTRSSLGSVSDFHIDAVIISHEFTDHCHRATLEELPRHIPIFAADIAAGLIRSWSYFETVITIPNLETGIHWSKLTVLGGLPSFLRIGRATTAGNALYYHSAILVAFDISRYQGDAAGRTEEDPAGEVIIYSPHGIESQDLAGVQSCGLKTLALLHGLHDVRIWMMKQLNLGALNGIKAVSVSGAKYWIATHDEVKKGSGIIGGLLRRTQYTLQEAVASQQKQLEESGQAPEYQFIELGSGDGILLE
ncbi:hypothetical protein PT974_08091 [Cladobotryum mycophilum]|uniref:Metallo-beta-lactamase domain-containing protein n=1 Tax=Cladobotryum mycophilum TaxID=491253 RepID=A0ABR0SCE3_9HYPO